MERNAKELVKVKWFGYLKRNVNTGIFEKVNLNISRIKER